MASSSKKILQSTPSKNEGDKSWIPEGYVTVAGPDGKDYLVPEFMVPTIHQSFDGYRKKLDLGVQNAAGSVHDINSDIFGVIGEGKIMAPTIPGSSDRERLSAHAEVIALQDRLGISYKDAAHRLCMAEIERLKSDERMYKSFGNLKISVENALGRYYDDVRDIEGSVTSDADV